LADKDWLGLRKRHNYEYKCKKQISKSKTKFKNQKLKNVFEL
jgi:hypothetical protein